MNPSTLPNLWYRYGDSAESGFGGSITGIGDQNNDGFQDVLIAVRNQRKVLMYFGGSPMDTTPALVFHRDGPNFGYYVANIADINGDGKIDFAIASLANGTYLYLAGSLDTTVYRRLPAGRVTGAGDVNGDGFADVLLSDESWNNYQGRAWLYLGGNPMDTIADWSVQGDSTRYWFGFSITGNGDLNHDGYKDIAISGFRALLPGGPPYIKVFLGGPVIDTIPRMILDRYQLPIGDKVWIVNDLNGDSYDELVTVDGPDTGLYVFFGRDSLRSTPDLVLHGSGFSAPADLRVASLGDVNGDGYNDVVSGNPSAWGGLGEVLLYLGHPNMSGEFDIGWTGFSGDWVGAGQAVGWCGDVNRDSLNDIMFSSYDPNWPTRNGRVDIFGGDTSLIVAVTHNDSRGSVPQEFELDQNYPNPFNPSTSIKYRVNARQLLSLHIYDVRGTLIRTLFRDMVHQLGEYSIEWNGADERAKQVASGIYFYRIESPSQSTTRKMLLIR